MEQNDILGFFATLHAKISGKTKPLLSWDIVFEPSVSASMILLRKSIIEQALNEYLERNVDTVANELAIPFTNTMVATADPLVYSFRIKVFQKSIFKRKLLFPYPPEPIKRVNGFILVLLRHPHPGPGSSHINTVAIKPPPD